MKRFFKLLVKTTAVACSAAVMIGAFCSGKNYVGIRADAASKVDLNYLMTKYPEGKYWNHVGKSGNNAEGYTDKPCHHALVNGLYKPVGTCNNFYGIQCWGFVNKLANECYGTTNHGNWPRTTLSKLKPGDAIRFKYNTHSIFVTGVDGENVTYGECNGAYHDCQIHWNVKTTKSEIAKSLSAVYSAPSELTVNLANRSTLKTDKIKFGQNVQVQGDAIGGKGTYQYQFSVLKPSAKNYTVVQKYSSSSYCSYHPWLSGTYQLKVTVKDKSGKTADKTFKFSVSADPVSNKTTINKKIISFGENIQFNFNASGGTKGYQYRISALKPTEDHYITIKNYNSSKKFLYHPWESGEYRIKVDAKDCSGKVNTKEFAFTVKADKLFNKTTAADNIIYGNDVTFEFAASGGTAGYVYEIQMEKPSSEQRLMLRKFQSGTKFIYHPWEKGEYRFYITVRDNSYHLSTLMLTLNVSEEQAEENI